MNLRATLATDTHGRTQTHIEVYFTFELKHQCMSVIVRVCPWQKRKKESALRRLILKI